MKSDYTGDIDVSWEDEDNNRTVELTVHGTISAYYPAKISGPPEDCYPAEGGELEDWEITVNEVTFYNDDGDELPVAITDEIKKKIADDYDTLLHECGDEFHRVQEQLAEQAGDAEEEAAICAAEARWEESRL